ncbi:hypothetical protein Esi_0058_0141 [Ectocarpus siliculosus]|uniref:Uncharacterized protein n=1 Tax=Ectocarpus siliculosus TaxID=2880 RepID=D7G4W9_ECTSI|nr:hypothetical protein Esi_0058_0141 [Ectocarpus siliculosus]|eukprot:CBJ27212.1 hypothetical protein Esi_0058_0141 [Ectocarpus siliculosus]
MAAWQEKKVREGTRLSVEDGEHRREVWVVVPLLQRFRWVPKRRNYAPSPVRWWTDAGERRMASVGPDNGGSSDHEDPSRTPTILHCRSTTPLEMLS